MVDARRRLKLRHPAISRQGVARRALRSSAPSARVFVITHRLRYAPPETSTMASTR